MKKSAKIAMAMAFVFISVKLMAQEPLPKVQEFGIGLSNLNSFSMQYLWGTENRLSRLSLTLGITNSNTLLPKRYNSVNDSTQIESITSQTTPININGGISYSILKIKPLTDKFGLVFGSIYAFSGSYQLIKSTQTDQEFRNGIFQSTSTTTSKSSSTILQPSIGLVIGAVYNISPAFSIYAEIDPHIYYQHTVSIISEGNNQYGNSYGLASLSNSAATLTLVYKIIK